MVPLLAYISTGFGDAGPPLRAPAPLRAVCGVREFPSRHLVTVSLPLFPAFSVWIPLPQFAWPAGRSGGTTLHSHPPLHLPPWTFEFLVFQHMGSPNNDPDMKFLIVGTTTDAPPRTAAELAREKKLRDDPMADVHGPLFVTCKRCGSRIKLSPKSSYDPFHWMKHRERCLRKPVGVARAGRGAPKDIYTSLTKKSSASSSNGDNATPPPLTPDDDRPAASDVFRETSPSPSPSLSSAKSDDPDLSVSKTADAPLVERWQTWNWSELRPPMWLAERHLCSSASDEDQELDDDHDNFLLDPVDMRYPAPRLVPHPPTHNQGTPPIVIGIN